MRRITYTDAIALIDEMMLEHVISDRRLGEVRGFVVELHAELLGTHRSNLKKIGQLEYRIAKARKIAKGWPPGAQLKVLDALSIPRGKLR